LLESPLFWKALGDHQIPAGGTLVIVRRLIVPLIAAVFASHAIEARAQSALPGALAAPQGDSAFPPVNSAAPTPVIGGTQGAFPSSGAPPIGVGGFSQAGPPGEAEQRGAMIKTASDRHAPPDEACKLIGNFAQSEIKMIKYVEAHAQQCGILADVREQMKTGHRNTESMLKKVCDAAKQQPAGMNPKWLQIAERLRLLEKPFILEDLTLEGLTLEDLTLEGLTLEGLGDHQTLPEELS
jgi:hypothetical protein